MFRVDDTHIRLPKDESAEDIFKLARSIGTLARRVDAAQVSFAFGHEQTLAAVRTSLIGGLVCSGHKVLDLGRCTARQHEDAMSALMCTGGLFIDGEDEFNLALTLGGGPMVGERLSALVEIRTSEVFCAATGELVVVDPFTINPSPKNHASSDTAVGS